MKERINPYEAADMLGISRHSIVRMANNGQMPGAAKIGGRWTFDREKLRKFILQREEACQRKISTIEMGSIGYKYPSGGKSSDDRFTQAILKLQGKQETKRLSK